MKKTILITMMAVCSMQMQAQFSGNGQGTEKDPYQVTNADELFEVRNNLSAYYIIMNDIDLTKWIQEDNPKYGWSPIGTEKTPFTGNLNGNNKLITGLNINRSEASNVGLFGYTQDANINNIVLINPIIYGKDNIGGIVGYALLTSKGTYTLKNSMVCGGTIVGSNNVGGVIGNADAVYSAPSCTSYSSDNYYSNCYFDNNYCSANITGSENAGGIYGVINSGSYTAEITYNWTSKNYGYTKITPQITNNRFDGEVKGDSNIGGIAGALKTKQFNLQDAVIGVFERNIITGRVVGKNSVAGVIGNAPEGSFTGSLASNVCCSDTISASQTEAFCISAIVGSQVVNNYHLFTAVLISNNKEREIADDDNNGTGYSLKNLQKQSTYAGIGYNFNTEWGMVEGATFPYLKNQSAPAWSTSFQDGSKGSIVGKAYGNGKVYVNIGENIYEGNILDKTWSISLGNIASGTEAKIFACYNGMTPSVCTRAISSSAPIVTILAGDANGDGMVDTADVTAIINYILGKPSASFNKENADVTGDGDILIDDAVQTVQLIMNAQ